MRQQSEQTLQLIHTSKRGRIANYPYYPISCSLIDKSVGYLFGVDTYTEDPHMSIYAFPRYQQNDNDDYDRLKSFYFQMRNLPKRLVNYLQILEYKGNLDSSHKNILVQSIDFILGFSQGYLIRAKYTHKPKPNFQILQKFNEKPNPKQGFLMRMSNKFFSSENWYTLSVEKPVLSFKTYSNNSLSQKYRYSYQIGNRLFFAQQINSKINIQQQTLRTFDSIQWELIATPSVKKLGNARCIAMKSTKHTTIITNSSILIDWNAEISSYVYTGEHRLIIANNTQNKIIIYNLQTMDRQVVYRVNWQIKKMKFYQYYPDFQNNINAQKIEQKRQGKYSQLLFIMPYDNNLFILDLTNNCTASLKGHRSFITNSIMTPESQALITGGCDHRVGIKKVSKLKNWIKNDKFTMRQDPNKMSKIRREIEVQQSRNTLDYTINSDLLEGQKFGQIFFFGEFDNVNRHNNNEYGFGNFLYLGNQIYAYLTYDFLVKIYKIKV